MWLQSLPCCELRFFVTSAGTKYNMALFLLLLLLLVENKPQNKIKKINSVTMKNQRVKAKKRKSLGKRIKIDIKNKKETQVNRKETQQTKQ